MFQILEAVKTRDLVPAIKWCENNRETLMKRGSELEFSLHRLQFLHLLCNRTRQEALQYAKSYFQPFAETNIKGKDECASTIWIILYDVGGFVRHSKAYGVNDLCSKADEISLCRFAGPTPLVLHSDIIYPGVLFYPWFPKWQSPIHKASRVLTDWLVTCCDVNVYVWY